VSRRTRILRNLGVAVCLVAMTGAFIVMVFIADHTNSKLSSDEHATCLIQQRGLPASKALAESIKDINELLTPAPGERSAPVPPRTLAVIVNLRAETARYVRIEAKQPSSREC
jgi:hypothetical protein